MLAMNADIEAGGCRYGRSTCEVPDRSVEIRTQHLGMIRLLAGMTPARPRRLAHRAGEGAMITSGAMIHLADIASASSIRPHRPLLLRCGRVLQRPRDGVVKYSTSTSPAQADADGSTTPPFLQCRPPVRRRPHQPTRRPRPLAAPTGHALAERSGNCNGCAGCCASQAAWLTAASTAAPEITTALRLRRARREVGLGTGVVARCASTWRSPTLFPSRGLSSSMVSGSMPPPWRVIGCPYDEGVTLAHSDDADDPRRVWSFDSLGVRRQRSWFGTRTLGVRSISRGARSTTRANPAGPDHVVPKCCGLVTQGLRNGDSR